MRRPSTAVWRWSTTTIALTLACGTPDPLTNAMDDAGVRSGGEAPDVAASSAPSRGEADALSTGLDANVGQSEGPADVDTADRAAGPRDALSVDGARSAAQDSAVTRLDAAPRDAQGVAITDASASPGDARSDAGGASSACTSVASTATRPQLTAAAAATHTASQYLAKAGPLSSLVTDDWSPSGGIGPAAALQPTFIVAADGSGTHSTVQAAVAAVSGAERQFIRIKAGTYRESVAITSPTPITIYGADADASRVVIVDNKSAASAGGTAGSATVTARSSGFQAMNLTIANDYATPASGTNIQAVALYTTGDKIVLQNVRVLGFQDTLYVDTPSATTVARVYIRDSYIEGDTDFIFGRATAVFDGSTIQYLASRKGSGAGILLAPSTSVGNDYGFLLVNCRFTAEASAPLDKVYLGRSWDQSSTTPTPNGQAVIRESTLGAHVNRAAPWTDAATSGRTFSASGNRFAEWCNGGPGAR